MTHGGPPSWRFRQSIPRSGVFFAQEIPRSSRTERSGKAAIRAHLGHGPPSIQTRKSARARSADAPPLGSSRFVLETGSRCRFSPARNKRLRFATTDLGRHSATAFREGALGWRLLSCRNRAVFRSSIAAPSQTTSGETGVARDRRPQGENKKPRGSPPGSSLVAQPLLQAAGRSHLPSYSLSPTIASGSAFASFIRQS